MNTRREQFEKAYADAHDMPLETFHQYRMGDTYRLPMIAKCWRFWQMGVEAGIDPEKSTTVNPVPVEPRRLGIAYADGCMVCGEWGGHHGLPCPRTRVTCSAALVAQLQSDLTDRDEEIDELRSAGQPAGEGV